jgi:hypothetical protein
MCAKSSFDAATPGAMLLRAETWIVQVGLSGHALMDTSRLMIAWDGRVGLHVV